MRVTLRRLVGGRVPLVLAVVACIAGLIALAPSLVHLRASRMRADALDQLIARPLVTPGSLVSPENVVVAPDMLQAQAILRQLLRDISVREGVLVEALAEAPAGGPAAAIAVSVSGDQAHVLRFAEAVENRAPVIRFATWRIEAAGPAGSLVRLHAVAVIVWSRGP